MSHIARKYETKNEAEHMFKTRPQPCMSIDEYTSRAHHVPLILEKQQQLIKSFWVTQWVPTFATVY